jgi:hypothetical protein
VIIAELSLILQRQLGKFMKNSTIITALAAILMMVVTPAFAQEESGEEQL